MGRIRPTVLTALIVLMSFPVIAFGDAPSFETAVRPILKAHCWQCHGEEEEMQGGLDARLVRFLLEGGESGPAVVPGDHKASLMFQRMASGEMPPGEKKVSTEELDQVAGWIDSGASTLRPEPEALATGDTFTEEERNHWSFQPIAKQVIPDVARSELVRTPIDSFLLAKLEDRNLSFSPEADRETLLRRIYFDLIGLPPSIEAVNTFVADESPEAWTNVVDELLNSPAYGERWARHWLDVAGYADSDGYTTRDTERKWAWKYRDYVIRSLNADKPWDQFLIEQLAGDELLTPPYQDLTPEQADRLIATGFLRMCPDGTADGSVDQNTARNDVMAEAIKVASTSLLGLTVGCAQCHAHRYDPISQADYYRLRAIFEPAYDVQHWRVPNGRLVSLWSAETRAVAAAADAELADVEKQRTEELDSIVSETFERELLKLPAEQQPLARAARETASENRTPEQNQLIKEYPFLNVDRGSVYLYLPDRLTGFKKKWDALIEETKKKRPADDNVMCLNEVPGQVPVTNLFSRGDFRQPRQEIAPGELSVLNANGTTLPVNAEDIPTTGRRLRYAQHLTSGEHPLVARVLVNRFWLHHFGQGLVSTPGDFGIRGERPSHPELLDWLARDFMDNGWTLKRLHRMIVTSTAYRQSSVRRAELDAVDGDNRLLGRMNVRRLEAEVLRDAVLAVSGRLVEASFGPPVPVSPDDVGQIVIAVDTRDSAGRPTGKVESLGTAEFRRSIYVQVRRSMPLGILEPFDLPGMTPNCEKRNASTNAPQSLLMMNNPFIVQQAELLANRIRESVGADPVAQATLAWRLVFSKTPQESDVLAAVEFLTPPESTAVDQSASLNHFCHALLSSNGFLYVD
ncbi:MAG: PSD1 and planctomycete cytochrome C domain-containing protein [Planctomycetaceae bacterium]